MDSSPRFGRSGSSGSGRYSSMQVPVSDVPLNPRPKPRVMHRNESSLDPDAQDNEGFGGSGRYEGFGGSGRPRMLSRKSSQALDRGRSTRFGSFDSYDSASGDDESFDGGYDGGNDGGGHVSMSLMALLAETDREMGLDGSAYMMGDDEDDEDEDEEFVQRDEYSNCCVCLVRHKGDAFTACGHSYCRLCSRELLVERGTCPLCNNFIMEILDVF